MSHPVSAKSFGHRQPYEYQRRELREPDWRRLPGFRHVTGREWRSAQWQRHHTVTTIAGLSAVFGEHLPSDLMASIANDRLATMGIRATPQVLNTMNDADLWNDPIRRYVLPAAADREATWHTHPEARRDSLREAEMSVMEGLVWRYPTKALVEIATTCPVYCGHCTRMDLVGPDVAVVAKRRMTTNLVARLDAIASFLAATPTIRDLVISGGDIANVPLPLLESFINRVLTTGHVRAFRLATKALVTLPQHFLDAATLHAIERIATSARERGVQMAVHTHTNHVSSLTPLVAEAVSNLRDAGVHHIRNQGVLLKSINDSTEAILDLCFVLADEVKITPYYFYLCDMIPHGEHWRTTLQDALDLQDDITGYLAGFDTPRFVCDVPRVGKRLVHQVKAYDRVRGVSSWSKSYLTPLDEAHAGSLDAQHLYFDPVARLEPEGQAFWTARLTPASPLSGRSRLRAALAHSTPSAPQVPVARR
jgi:lysine 2,3-aminomutase